MTSSNHQALAHPSRNTTKTQAKTVPERGRRRRDYVEMEIKLTVQEFERLADARLRLFEGTRIMPSVADYARQGALSQAERDLTPVDPLTDLESAVSAAVSFISLMSERVLSLEQSAGFNEEDTVGLIPLAAGVKDRLRAAFDAAHDYATGRAPGSGLQH